MLEHGQGKDGYWTYNRMIVQIKGVHDCLVGLFPDPDDSTRCQFDVAFELDHSSGHAKDRIGGLSSIPSILNTSHAGGQRIMRDTELSEGCFGTVQHARRKNVKDIQKMVFTDADLPPVNDPKCPKNDELLGVFSKETITVPELKIALSGNDLNSDGGRERLFSVCKAAGIATVKQVEKFTPGVCWEGKGRLPNCDNGPNHH